MWLRSGVADHEGTLALAYSSRALRRRSSAASGSVMRAFASGLPCGRRQTAVLRGLQPSHDSSEVADQGAWTAPTEALAVAARLLPRQRLKKDTGPTEVTRQAGDQGCCGVEVRGFEPLTSSVRGIFR